MKIAALIPVVGLALVLSASPTAQSGGAAGDVTFSTDIAPILQRSCQQCHNASGVAPCTSGCTWLPDVHAVPARNHVAVAGSCATPPSSVRGRPGGGPVQRGGRRRRRRPG